MTAQLQPVRCRAVFSDELPKIMKHELKTWTEYFQAVKSGAKTFEIRENDRNYQVGDVLWLREFIPCPECKGTRRVWPEGKRGCSQHCDECGDMPHAGIYTGEELEKLVTYITDFAQSNRRVVMALSENAELQRPREAGSVARSGSPAKREARPQQPEVPQSPAERGINKSREPEPETPAS